MSKTKRTLTASQKKSVAGRQYYKCANKPGSNLLGLSDYLCPLWDRSDKDIKGCFDKSGYEIDHIEEFCITQNDDLDNLQALCRMCHSVKTSSFMQNRKKSKKQSKKQSQSNSNRTQKRTLIDLTNENIKIVKIRTVIDLTNDIG